MSQPSNAASRAPAVKSDQTRDHDRLAWRLSDILLRLNQGQELVVDTKTNRKSFSNLGHINLAQLAIQSVTTPCLPNDFSLQQMRLVL